MITGSISTAEYGYFNLIVTIDNLITPMLTLQISDAVFRCFILAKTDDEKKKIFSSGTSVILIGIIVVSLIIFSFNTIIEYPFWVAVYIISTNLFAYIQKVTRSLGENKQYVVSNLMKSILYFALMILCIAKFNFGVRGLFIANCVSTYICIFYLVIKIDLKRYLNIRNVELGITREMIRFSAPLIPNTAIWWLQSSVNSLILSAQLGLDSNGIYSVAVKFASVLHLITNVFDLAWQESAIKEYGTSEYRKFVTEIFNKYSMFILSGVSVMIPLLSVFGKFIIDESYQEAICYTPFFLISTALAAFSSFFAQMIVAKNRNIKLLITNIFGAIGNVVIMIALLEFIGLWAVVVSAIATYGIVAISRFIEVKDDFYISNIKFMKIFILVIMIVIACFVALLENNIIQIIIFLAYLGIFICFNKELINELLLIVLEKCKN